MDRAVDMAGDVVDQVLAHQPHQVAARVADEVLRLIFVPAHAHVAVDRRQAVGDGAAALDVGLFDQGDLQIAAPVSRFVGGAAAAEAAADDEDVGVDDVGFLGGEQAHGVAALLVPLSPGPSPSRGEGSVGKASTLSTAGSCASSGEFSAAASGAA